MKFSYEWLRELVPGLTTEPAELQRLISMKTAECEGIEAAGVDTIIEIDNKSLTHRPDLWGHFGMAREVAAITGGELRDPVKPELLPCGEGACIGVEIADYGRAARYSALCIEGLEVKPSPAWLAERLERIGLNAINNVVDVTNYVLAELPQPMHAFDAEKLAGNAIQVRSARAGEKLRALNGETYELSEVDLVIADAAGPVALAGVIGGADSAISERTKRIVLESANFQASGVRLTSVRHKLRTDASIRFEKSLDPENTLRGLARALELLRELSPGLRVMGGVADDWRPAAQPAPILLPLDFVFRKLGIVLREDQVTGILGALGFGVERAGAGVLRILVPTWRATRDISGKADLVEEIGRMIGYGEIAPVAPLVQSTPPPANPLRRFLRGVRAQLAAQGFTETYNYSFTNETETARFHLPIEQHLRVVNPIASELTHLRRSLLPGLFKNLQANVRHFSEFRLFEVGNEIHPGADDAPPREIPHLAALLYGAQADEAGFFELKRALECVFPQARLAPAEARPYEHPFRTADISWDGTKIGRQFELHPALLEAEGIPGRAFLIDVDLQLAERLAAARQVVYAPPGKYPASGFDVSVVAPFKEPVASIEQLLAELAGESLAALDFVRQYSGPPLLEGQKSVSYRIEISAADHTLTSDEVAAIRGRLVNGVRAAGFEIRGIEG